MLLLTVPVGIGITAAGTLMPVVVKEEHPDRPALGTGVYTTGINVGATAAALAAAPLAAAIGWRGTLVAYSVLSLGAVLPWLARRHGLGGAPRTHAAPVPRRHRVAARRRRSRSSRASTTASSPGWRTSTPNAVGATEAGELVAVLNAFSLVTGVATALTADRIGSRRLFLRIAAAFAVTGAVAIAANLGGAWLWAALLGVSAGALFTMVMTLPLDAAGSRAEVAAMTTLMLGVGYSISACAPAILGAVRDAAGSFTAALALLAATPSRYSW